MPNIIKHAIAAAIVTFALLAPAHAQFGLRVGPFGLQIGPRPPPVWQGWGPGHWHPQCGNPYFRRTHPRWCW